MAVIMMMLGRVVAAGTRLHWRYYMICQETPETHLP